MEYAPLWSKIKLDYSTIYYQILLGFFIDIFDSELLFSLWSLILKNMLEGNQTIFCSILSTLINRFGDKIIYIQTNEELIECLRLEGKFNLINDIKVV